MEESFDTLPQQPWSLSHFLGQFADFMISQLAVATLAFMAVEARKAIRCRGA